MIRKFVALAVVLAGLVALVACAPAATPTPTPAPQGTPKPAAASPTTAAAKPAAASPTTAAPKPAAKALEKVKMQIPNKSAGYLDVYLGKEKGVFEQEGLDLEIVVLQANLGIPALLNGDVDYIVTAADTFEAVMKGEPFRVVMQRKVNNAWHIFLAAGVSSAKEFEGKSLGIRTVASNSRFATDRGLKALGVDPTKVTYVGTTSNADLLAALKSGAVAGASITSPDYFAAAAQGFKEVLDTRNVAMSPSGMAATTKKIQENPDQVKRMMRANLKAIVYMKEHKDEAVQWLTKEFSLEKGIAEKVLEEEIAFRTTDGSVTDEALANQVETVRLDAGFENTTVDQLKKAVDTALLQQVQKEMGLSR